MGSTPFIHMFQTPLGYYLFDVNTNQLINVEEDVYEYLKNIEDGNDDETVRVIPQIAILQEKGYLSDYHPVHMQHNHSDILEYHLNYNIQQITLQVTQACNFRCAYCAYAVPDFATQRQHAPKKMSLETALRAVEFFVNHSVNQQKVSIGFYGGEPLLAEELIRKVVIYAEEAFEGKEVLFTITTNGSLFTPQNMKFLSDHNFSVVISLDGPPEMHNRSRKFAANGEGTFSVIEKNLNIIKNDYPCLFKKISINSVIDPRYGCQKTHDMFTKNPLYKDISVRATIIDDAFSVEKVFQSEEYSIENNINMFQAIMSQVGRYPQERVSKVALGNLLENKEKLEQEMEVQKQLPETTSHSGPCLPGQRRLFINVDGNFFPCERVSETSPVMEIGNINDGFNFDKARKLLNIVQLTPEECRNCWALMHCHLCARFCDNNGTFSAKYKLANCPGVRASVEEKFKDALLLKEISQ